MHTGHCEYKWILWIIIYFIKVDSVDLFCISSKWILWIYSFCISFWIISSVFDCVIAIACFILTIIQNGKADIHWHFRKLFSTNYRNLMALLKSLCDVGEKTGKEVMFNITSNLLTDYITFHIEDDNEKRQVSFIHEQLQFIGKK